MRRALRDITGSSSKEHKKEKKREKQASDSIRTSS